MVNTPITVIALGNPEPEYAGTRHNVARDALDAFAKAVEKTGGTVSDWNADKMRKAKVAKAVFSEKGEKLEVILVRPNTYMNLSGESARHFATTPAEKEALIVVHDELDLPLGVVKIAYARGAGGHNGVQSVSDHLGTRDFARIRIGVAPADETGRATRHEYQTGADFVLDRFSDDEKAKVDASIAKAVEMIFGIAKLGVSEAMNRLN